MAGCVPQNQMAASLNELGNALSNVQSQYDLAINEKYQIQSELLEKQKELQNLIAAYLASETAAKQLNQQMESDFQVALPERPKAIPNAAAEPTKRKFDVKLIQAKMAEKKKPNWDVPEQWLPEVPTVCYNDENGAIGYRLVALATKTSSFSILGANTPCVFAKTDGKQLILHELREEMEYGQKVTLALQTMEFYAKMRSILGEKHVVVPFVLTTRAPEPQVYFGYKYDEELQHLDKNLLHEDNQYGNNQEVVNFVAQMKKRALDATKNVLRLKNVQVLAKDATEKAIFYTQELGMGWNQRAHFLHGI